MFKKIFAVILSWVLSIYFPAGAWGQGSTSQPRTNQEEEEDISGEKVEVIQTIDVKRGDTLWHIAEKYLEDPNLWPELLKYNKIDNPDLIHPGDKLRVPQWLARKIPREARFSFIQNQVEMRRKERDRWVPARISDPTGEGDEVKTGVNSSAELTLDEGSKIDISPRTAVKVSRLYTDLKTGGNRSSFKLDGGRIFAKVSKTERNSRFSIRTPTAVAAVSGTDFIVEVEEDKVTKVAVIDGSVQVAPSTGEEEEEEISAPAVEVRAGESVQVASGQMPLAPVKLPEPPSPLSPLPGSRIREDRVAFSWSGVEGAVSYELEVSPNPDFDRIVLAQRASGQDYRAGLIPEGEYYWRLRSLNRDGFGRGYSQVSKFATLPVPGAPAQLSSQQAFRIDKREVALSWSGVAKAASYGLEIAKDPNFAEVVVKDSPTATQYTVDILAKGPHYWRVKAISKDGIESEYSEASKMEIIDYGEIVLWGSIGLGVGAAAVVVILLLAK
jgi:hypothetical protein